MRGKLQDGQLSNSPLTLRDIDRICHACATVLDGVSHERIEYPDPPAHIPQTKEHPTAEPPAVRDAEEPWDGGEDRLRFEGVPAPAARQDRFVSGDSRSRASTDLSMWSPSSLSLLGRCPSSSRPPPPRRCP